MVVSFGLFVESDSSVPGEEQRLRRDLVPLAFPVFGFELINLNQFITNLDYFHLHLVPLICCCYWRQIEALNAEFDSFAAMKS
jgi:hypothetical protein